MTTTEIKKALYRTAPDARLAFIRRGIAHYSAVVGESLVPFEVPVSDMGDADFLPVMEAKLLIRYLVNPYTAP